MAACKTVKVVFKDKDKFKGRVVEINKDDFSPAVHQFPGEVAKPIVAEKSK